MAAQLQQIRLGFGPDGYEATTRHEADNMTYSREQEALTASLLRSCPAHVWPKHSYKSSCPRPILIEEHHQHQLLELHEALTTAITDIVQRWWTDVQAQFPKRMPLMKEEEDLLQWMESQIMVGNLPQFSACRGSWRPDFLVEDDVGQGEAFRITEINARFPFNGFLHAPYGQVALEEMGANDHGLKSVLGLDGMLNGLLSLFRPELPLHLVKGEENGFDIHMVIDVFQHRFGVKPSLVSPADLRLLADPKSKSGYKLCCVSKRNEEAPSSMASDALATSNGEVLEEIHQVGLELHQHELLALGPEMLRQISLRCFNDLRTILLVHDKRMLGLVKQELQPLVDRGVLTSQQAQILDNGVADTLLPGSTEMHELMQTSKTSPRTNFEYILKPVRGGKGAGIVFGEDLGPDEWMSLVKSLQTSELPKGGTCVAQRRLRPRLYDLVLDTSGNMLRYQLVGTYHVIHGKLLGLGIWRSSGDRICALSTGGSWLCSVARQTQQ